MLPEWRQRGHRQCINADTVDEGIVVCGYKLKDMMYTDLREYLSGKIFDMLLVASQDKWSDGLVRGVMGLSMPIESV